MGLMRTLNRWGAAVEAPTKSWESGQKKTVAFVGFAIMAVLLAAALIQYLRWRDVTMVVEDRHVCSDMVSRGFKVTGTDTGGCRLEHVNVDLISALNPFGKTYKADQLDKAFDISTNGVRVER